MKANLEFIQWMILFFDVNYEPRGKLRFLFFTFSFFRRIRSGAKSSAMQKRARSSAVEIENRSSTASTKKVLRFLRVLDNESLVQNS